MESDVLVLARQGNLEGWIAQCLAEVRAMAFSFAQSSGISADDLLQEVGLRLALKSELVLAARKPGVYARVLARNVMRGQYRKVARRRRLVQIVQLDERRDLV